MRTDGFDRWLPHSLFMARSSTDVHGADEDLGLALVDAPFALGCSQVSAASSVQNASVVPDGGLVDLYRNPVEQRFEAVHGVTLERVPLPKGVQRCMVVSPDKWTAFEDEDDQVDAITFEELRSKVLLDNDDGTRWIQLLKKGTVVHEYSLTKKKESSNDVKLTVCTGALRSPTTVEAYHLLWPRRGLRFYVSTSSLYRTLQMVSYSEERSKWAYDCQDSWRRFFVKCFRDAGDCIMPSKHCEATTAGGNRIAGIPSLDSMALSSMALIALLSRWSGMVPKRAAFVTLPFGALPASFSKASFTARYRHQAWTYRFASTRIGVFLGLARRKLFQTPSSTWTDGV